MHADKRATVLIYSCRLINPRRSTCGECQRPRSSRCLTRVRYVSGVGAFVRPLWRRRLQTRHAATMLSRESRPPSRLARRCSAVHSAIVRRATTARFFVRRKHRRPSTSAPCSSSSAPPGDGKHRFCIAIGICSWVGTPVWVGSPDKPRMGDPRVPSSQEPTGRDSGPKGASHRIER